MSLKDVNWIRKIVYFWRSFRNSHSYKSGKNNKVINHGGIRVSTRIQITGYGNRVILERGGVLLNSLIIIKGDNNEVILKGDSYVSGAELWIEDNQCTLIIGERTFVGHHSHLACTEDGSKLIIGDDGMLSSYVQIRTGDSHSILDPNGNRINQAQSVVIGDHCWLGEGAKVLKGVTLKRNVIVSTGAIVTKSFGENVLLGGVPAKVLKDNVTWEKDRI